MMNNHEPDSTINRQAVSNRMRQKMSESNLNEMLSKIFKK